MAFTTELRKYNGDLAIALKDLATGTEAEIYTVGGLLNAFIIHSENYHLNVVEGFAAPADARNNLSQSFKSAKLSPFVCRLNHGMYHWNNRGFKVEKFYLHPHAIHGIIYDAEYEVKNLYSDDHEAVAGLRYLYDGYDPGYPFPFEINIQWKLEAGSKVTVSTQISHENESAIFLADGWHPYFTLGGDIDDCTLAFNSDTLVEFDETLVPTGRKIKDTRFMGGLSLKGIVLDHCYAFGQGPASCVLSNHKWKLVINAEKNYPYLQVYTPGHRKSIALENLSAAPDAFNNKMGLTEAEPGKTYTFTASYRIEKQVTL